MEVASRPTSLSHFSSIVIFLVEPDHTASYGPLLKCRDCGNDRPSEEYRWVNRKNRRGKVYRYKILRCKTCTSTRDNEKLAAKQARWLLKGYRKRDREAGFGPTDLDYDTVESLIREPCSYCEDTKITMTLDRKDVVPACFRCNMLRGSMPYEAWLYVAKTVKEARLLGLFGTWIGPSANRLRKH